jgi:endonuclease YncB( thermonuclease family)
MSYRLIKGTFALYYQGQRHVGSRPDADSMWFKPDNPSLLSDLGGRDADFNGGGFAQLRFEGIDALELHYPHYYHQHEEGAVEARDFLLEKAGFTDVVYAPNADIPRCVRSCAPESVRGYILSQTIDPYGRPVSFVFRGAASETDGTEVYLDVNRMNQSLNADLIRKGHVYPAYYAPREDVGGLPWDLRDHLTSLSDNAWAYDWGVWEFDVSRANPRIRNMDELTELAIWPKLYRRLALYFLDGNNGLAHFEQWLTDNDKDDRIFILSRGENTHLHGTFEIRGNRINMRYWPEELLIYPG